MSHEYNYCEITIHECVPETMKCILTVLSFADLLFLVYSSFASLENCQRVNIDASVPVGVSESVSRSVTQSVGQ